MKGNKVTYLLSMKQKEICIYFITSVILDRQPLHPLSPGLLCKVNRVGIISTNGVFSLEYDLSHELPSSHTTSPNHKLKCISENKF